MNRRLRSGDQGKMKLLLQSYPCREFIDVSKAWSVLPAFPRRADRNVSWNYHVGWQVGLRIYRRLVLGGGHRSKTVGVNIVEKGYFRVIVVDVRGKLMTKRIVSSERKGAVGLPDRDRARQECEKIPGSSPVAKARPLLSEYSPSSSPSSFSANSVM